MELFEQNLLKVAKATWIESGTHGAKDGVLVPPGVIQMIVELIIDRHMLLLLSHRACWLLAVRHLHTYRCGKKVNSICLLLISECTR